MIRCLYLTCVMEQEITRRMDPHDIIEQCLFIHVGLEIITMGYPDLVQGRDIKS
jgi:hypothetical protein